MKKTLSAFIAIILFFLANEQWLGTSLGLIYLPYNNVGIRTTTLSILLSIGKEFGNGTTNIQRYSNLTDGSSCSPFSRNGLGMSFFVDNNYNPASVLDAIDIVNEYYNSASNIRFYTVSDSTLTVKMRIDGRVYLGIDTIAPS